MNTFRQKLLASVAAVTLTALSVQSHGWEYGVDVNISSITQWEGGGNILVKFSNGLHCYTPPEEKEMYSFLLASYMAGKTVTVHCYDLVEATNTYTVTHKLHRVIAN